VQAPLASGRDYWRGRPVLRCLLRPRPPDDNQGEAAWKQQEYLMETTNPVTPITSATESCGTKDGSTAADNDQPYRYGLRPTVDARFPFTERQFARLLIMRALVRDQIPNGQRAEA
jgi:hypothetical protein